MTLEDILANYLPLEAASDELSDFFALFADRTRMRILSLLSVGELCVNDISFVLGLNQSTVSHQLRNLKDKNLVGSRKDGKRTFYYISNGKLEDFFMQAVLATEE